MSIALPTYSVLFLQDRIPWFGRFAGYERLPEYLEGQVKCSNVTNRLSPLARYIGSGMAQLRGRQRQGARSFAHLEFQIARVLKQPHIAHVLYGESNADLFRSRRIWPKSLVASFHLPKSKWTRCHYDAMKRLQSAIILTRREQEAFEELVGVGRTRFIPHGVDIDFFCPMEVGGIAQTLRLVFSGVWLRNEQMLVRVVNRLFQQYDNVRIDLLVPQHHLNESHLKPLLRSDRVTVHAGLDDNALRKLYQGAYLMLLPMDDSGANNSILEALATGLPVVTTDVGGIRDYGGGCCYPIVENNDDDSMIQLVEHYIQNPTYRSLISRAIREFAEVELAWPVVAQKHLDAYADLQA